MNENKYMRDATYNTMGNITYFFCLWVITILVVRLSGYEAAGILSVAMTTTNIFFVIANYGMRSFQASDVNNEYSNQQYILSRYITTFIGFLLCIIFCVMSKYDYTHFSSIIIYMCFKSIEALSDAIYGVWQTKHQLKCAGISMSLKGILSIIVFSVAMGATGNLNYALGSMVTISLLVTILYDLRITVMVDKTALNISANNLVPCIRLIRKTFTMFIVSVCPMILQAIPKLLFERKYTTEDLGIYSSIASPTIIIPTFISCIMIPVLPLFAKYIYKNQKIELLKIFLLFLFGVLIIGCIACLCAKYFGGIVLEIIYGDDLTEYVNLLVYLIISVTLTCVLYCLNALFIAGRKLLTLAVVYVATNLLCYVLSIHFIDMDGIYGIAEALNYSQLLQCLVLVVLAIPFFGVISKRE